MGKNNVIQLSIYSWNTCWIPFYRPYGCTIGVIQSAPHGCTNEAIPTHTNTHACTSCVEYFLNLNNLYEEAEFLLKKIMLYLDLITTVKAKKGKRENEKYRNKIGWGWSGSFHWSHSLSFKVVDPLFYIIHWTIFSYKQYAVLLVGPTYMSFSRRKVDGKKWSPRS